jgi:hypothetical protein
MLISSSSLAELPLKDDTEVLDEERGKPSECPAKLFEFGLGAFGDCGRSEEAAAC